MPTNKNSSTKLNLSVLSILTLVMSIVQLFFNFLPTGFDSNLSDVDPIIVPVGYTFAIWGVILLLGLGYGIYQLIDTKNQLLYTKINPYICVLNLGFCTWLIAAGQKLIPLTIAIFVVMYVCLFKVFTEINTYKEQINWILKSMAGIYFGWTSIAIIVNIAVYGKLLGATDLNGVGLINMILVLLLATCMGIIGIVKTRKNPYFFGTIIWALAGVIVGLYRYESIQNISVLQIICVGAMVLFALMQFYLFDKYPKSFLTKYIT